MKTLFTISSVTLKLLLLTTLAFSQNGKKGVVDKSANGTITSVQFRSLDRGERPVSAQAFLTTYLEVDRHDQFKKSPHKSKRENFVHDHYDQYYKGVRVDGAGYNFHFEKGSMFFANGHYVRVGNLNVNPTISKEAAIKSFLEFQKISPKAVAKSVTDLFIKEITDITKNDTTTSIHLVYSVYLQADHPNNDVIGYVDAHSGKVVSTAPRAFDLLGTMQTRYSGTRQADTDPVVGGHRLFDDTRNATIHTRNLQNNTTVLANAVELIDNDNNWTAAEHAGNNNNMGLDVHWALQEIYDYFLQEYNIDSFDDAGEPIEAYVRYDTDADNAFWDLTEDVLLFGQGATTFDPLASFDVVAHEFGHGITDFQIGWTTATLDQQTFHEGMSDIWGAILESRIRPSNTWRIGEQVTRNSLYLRNLTKNNDVNAHQQIATTFGSSQYNGFTSGHQRGGVFSHWFYLLVNGGSGVNGIGNSYTVSGVGMDVAEEIIVEAVFNNYLDGTTSFTAIRTAIINAASTLCGDFTIEKAVTDAWHAVGVGAKYSGTETTISGSSSICNSAQGTFNLNNIPSGATITWSTWSGLSIVSGQGTGSVTVQANSLDGNGWVRATLTNACGSITLGRHYFSQGQPTWSPDLNIANGAYGESGFFCTSHTGNTYMIDPDNNLSTHQVRIKSLFGSVLWSSPTRSGASGSVNYYPSPGYYLIDVRATNSCGTSTWVETEVEFVDCSIGGGGGEGGEFSMYPNPSTIEVTIEEQSFQESVNQKQEKSQDALQPELFTIEVIDSNQNLKHRESCTKTKLTFSVQGWEKGIYYVKITKGDHTQTRQLIVE
ncbi:MAG: M4 family metallopeptidase [Bacteroidota bacterium]